MGGETCLLESNAQLGFGFGQSAERGGVEQALGEEQFLTGVEGDFYLGAQRLDEYLKANQQGWVVRLNGAVGELDYSPFSSGYRCTGRRAIWEQCG